MTGGGVCAEAEVVLCTAGVGSSTTAGVGYDPPASPTPSALVPSPPVVPPPTIDNSPSARESEDYARFARMLRMGVPKQAVAAKMQAEGLDPSVLDDSDDDLSLIHI